MGLSLPSDEPNPRCGRGMRLVIDFDDADRAEVVRAYRDDRRSTDWISARIGVSPNAVRNYLISIGVWRGRDR